MDVKLYLKDKNIKITKGRVCILNILMDIEGAQSADYIYEKCIEKGELIDLSTVYRTLELLEEKNIIDKFDLGDGRYNFILKENPHKHILQCEMCHKKIEIDCPMQQIQEIIKSKTGFTLLEHDLQLKGVCDECNKRKKEKGQLKGE